MNWLWYCWLLVWDWLFFRRRKLNQITSIRYAVPHSQGPCSQILFSYCFRSFLFMVRVSLRHWFLIKYPFHYFISSFSFSWNEKRWIPKFYLILDCYRTNERNGSVGHSIHYYRTIPRDSGIYYFCCFFTNCTQEIHRRYTEDAQIALIKYEVGTTQTFTKDTNPSTLANDSFGRNDISHTWRIKKQIIKFFIFIGGTLYDRNVLSLKCFNKLK